MKNLQHFAKFIKNEKLEEFVHVEIETLFLHNIPFVNRYKLLPEVEIITQTRAGLINFLTSLEEEKGISTVKQRLEEWQQDKIPGIGKNDVGITDIILIYSAQKVSLISFIPSFTADAAIAINIILELENYYKQVLELTTNILEKNQLQNLEKLYESEKKYKDLFESATDLIQIVAPDGKILYVNNAWLKALGYTIDEVTGRHITEFISAPEREIYDSSRLAALQDEQNPLEVRTCFITISGAELAVEGFITCRFKDGVAEYTRGILRDVTKRKEIERKLKFFNDQLIESEENLRQLIANAPDAIIVIDEKNDIVLWNPKAEQIFGWKSAEVIGTSLTEKIIPAEHRDAHNSGVERIIKTGKTKLINSTVEITALTKEKKLIYISLTLSQSKQGGKQVFISFIRDISAQKKNQLDLEVKTKLLEQSNEQLEQYAWLASHDLKEPLRKILTYSDLLLTRHLTSLPPTVANHLKKISAASERMNELIEAILQYAHVSDITQLFIPTNLNTIVEEVHSDIEVLLENTKGKVQVSTLPTIDAIPIHIRQLFQNLISNALKYRKPGVDPVIEITCDIVQDHCKIYFKDNSIGFDNKYAEKIFLVFQRLDTEKKGEGTGIGLSICKKIVEAHHGYIKANSVPGKGSVFEVMLPLNQR